MSMALVSRINLFSLKFKNIKFKDNKFRFIFITMSIILLTFIEFSAIPIIILIYMMMSIVKRKN